MFVLTEIDNDLVLGYYTLSSASIIFSELPKSVQKKFSRYPLRGATLLGRFGVHKAYRHDYYDLYKEKPRLGELLLTDAQKNTVIGARCLWTLLFAKRRLEKNCYWSPYSAFTLGQVAVQQTCKLIVVSRFLY